MIAPGLSVVMANYNHAEYIGEALDSYSNSGRQRWSEQKKVLEHMLDLLKPPTFEDVLPGFRHSGVLSAFGFKMLRAILARHDYWDLLTPVLVRRILGNGIYGDVIHAIPKPVKKICRKLNEKRRCLK